MIKTTLYCDICGKTENTMAVLEISMDVGKNSDSGVKSKTMLCSDHYVPIRENIDRVVKRCRAIY